MNFRLCLVSTLSIGDDPNFSAFNRPVFKFSVISVSRKKSSAVCRHKSIRIFFDERHKKESGHSSRRGFLSREAREARQAMQIAA